MKVVLEAGGESGREWECGGAVAVGGVGRDGLLHGPTGPRSRGPGVKGAQRAKRLYSWLRIASLLTIIFSHLLGGHIPPICNNIQVGSPD